MMPPHIKAHDHCSDNRDELRVSDTCGCFHCLEIFAPGEISQWHGIPRPDENGFGEETTAICPRCCVDAVIGSASGYPITRRFLIAMMQSWFNVDYKPVGRLWNDEDGNLVSHSKNEGRSSIRRYDSDDDEDSGSDDDEDSLEDVSIPVSDVFTRLSEGASLEQILETWPDLTRKDLQAIFGHIAVATRDLGFPISNSAKSSGDGSRW